jgi:replicative DNA helicase
MRSSQPEERQMPTAETHVPPQNLDAEASVLGAMMVSEGAIAPVILDVRLHDEDFYRERHRIVFRAITGLYEDGARVDGSGPRERKALRADRQAELAPAPAARHLAADPEISP